jgi:hypothetical protein
MTGPPGGLIQESDDEGDTTGRVPATPPASAAAFSILHSATKIRHAAAASNVTL